MKPISCMWGTVSLQSKSQPNHILVCVPCTKIRTGFPSLVDGEGPAIPKLLMGWGANLYIAKPRCFRYTIFDQCSGLRIYAKDIAYDLWHTPSTHQARSSNTFFLSFFPGVMGHAMRIPEICIFINARSW